MMNEQTSLIDLEQALSSLNLEDYQMILAEIDNVSWVEYNRILKGKPFSFANRDYLLQPYRDEYPDLIFYKGRQVEMSEFTMNWMLRKLHKHPYTAGLHTFPRTNQCNKFSKQRLEHAILDSKNLGEWYNNKGSEQLMRKFTRYNNESKLEEYNFYVMGGTWESRKDTVGDAARGLTIDFIAYDERQDHPNDVETVIGESASHSEFKQTITLGTPKLPGTQFDQQWESSDKHFWHVTCEHCGTCEPITIDNIFPTNEEDDYYYGCRKCKQPLKRLNGVWIPLNPKKKPLYRGYHINQLMVNWITANDIMKKYTNPTYSKRRFYNEVLGFAYGGDSVPITLQKLYACAENDYMLGDNNDDVYVGIDWGKTSWCIVQNKTQTGHKLVDIYICGSSDPREHPKTFAKLLKKYKKGIRKVVCDAGPDITYFYSLRDELASNQVCSKNNVYACYYLSPPVKTKINWDEKEKIVTVGRSEFIDMIIDEIDDTFFVIPGGNKSNEKIETMMDHFCNLSSERKKNNSGMEFTIYGSSGPDHLLHAKLYADVASYNANGIVLGGTAGSFNGKRDSMIKSVGDRNGRLLKSHKTNKSSSFPSINMKRSKTGRLK